MKYLSFCCLALLLSVTCTQSASSATLLTSQFTGTISGDTNTLDINWTGLESANGSDLTAVYPAGGSGFARPGNAFGSDGQAFVNTNLNIAPRSDFRGFSFTLTPSANYVLTNLQVETAHATSTGTAQTYTSNLHLTITQGVNTLVDQTKTDLFYNGTFRNDTFDLTGLTLSSSTAYIFTVAMTDLVGSGSFFSSDSLTLSAVPEPSNFAIVAAAIAGGLVFLRRRS